MATSPSIERSLVTGFFTPAVVRPGLEHMVLVMGTGMGEVLRTRQGSESDGGRLARLVAGRCGVTVCGYVRPGVEDGHPAHELVGLYHALDPGRPDKPEPAHGRYLDTMADVGAVIRQRILKHDAGAIISIVGKSSGATAGATLARSNTIGAENAVIIEPAGLHRFARHRGNTVLSTLAWAEYQLLSERRVKLSKPTEEQNHVAPLSYARIAKDMILNARIAGSDQTLEDLTNTAVPTHLELAESGMYSRVLDPRDIIAQFREHSKVTADIRRGVSHNWYDASNNYAAAVGHAMQRLGHWPIPL